VIGFQGGFLTGFGRVLDLGRSGVQGDAVLSPRWIRSRTLVSEQILAEKIPGTLRDALRFHGLAHAAPNRLTFTVPSWVSLSGYTGIALWVRGRSSSPLRVFVETTDTLSEQTSGTCVPAGEQRCDRFHGYDLTPSVDWREVQVPFARLLQPADGVPVELDLEHATAIGLGSTGGAHDIWIAAMGLY
jgi:hypothetical protein